MGGGLVHWGGKSQVSLSATSGALVLLVKWQSPRHFTSAFSMPSLLCLGTLQSIPSTFPSPSTLQIIYSPGRLGSFPPQGNEPQEEVTWQGRGGFRTSPGSSAFHSWIYSWDKLESVAWIRDLRIQGKVSSGLLSLTCWAVQQAQKWQ